MKNIFSIVRRRAARAFDLIARSELLPDAEAGSLEAACAHRASG
jgi:hypothetical protein